MVGAEVSGDDVGVEVSGEWVGSDEGGVVGGVVGTGEGS